MKVLSIPDYVEGTCLKASMDFISDEFDLRSQFLGPGSLLSAVKYLQASKFSCLVRAKALMRFRLRFAFWLAGLDVRVSRFTKTRDADGASREEHEATLHLVYCHHLYQLPPTERWWHYVVEVRRGAEIMLFDSFLARAKETFGEGCMTGYPSAAKLNSLSEVNLTIKREVACRETDSAAIANAE